MKIKYTTSTHKHQRNLSDLVSSTNPTEKPILQPQDCPRMPIVVEKDIFIAKRIDEGDSPIKALEEWLIVEKNRRK